MSDEAKDLLREALALVDELIGDGGSPWGSGTHRVIAWRKRARDLLRDEKVGRFIVRRVWSDESSVYDAEVWDGDMLVASVRVYGEAVRIALALSDVTLPAAAETPGQRYDRLLGVLDDAWRALSDEERGEHTVDGPPADVLALVDDFRVAAQAWQTTDTSDDRPDDSYPEYQRMKTARARLIAAYMAARTEGKGGGR